MSCFNSTKKNRSPATTESEFNIVKNVLFPSEKNIRVDVFTRRYIDNLNGRLIPTIVKNNTQEQQVADDIEKNSGSQQNLLHELIKENTLEKFIDMDNDATCDEPQENWRNLNLDIKRKTLKKGRVIH